MLTVGDEVIITGPNIWGQYLRQGNRGVIVGHAFGGFCVKMNWDDKTITYPGSSCSIYKVNRIR